MRRRAGGAGIVAGAGGQRDDRLGLLGRPPHATVERERQGEMPAGDDLQEAPAHRDGGGDGRLERIDRLVVGYGPQLAHAQHDNDESLDVGVVIRRSGELAQRLQLGHDIGAPQTPVIQPCGCMERREASARVGRQRGLCEPQELRGAAEAAGGQMSRHTGESDLRVRRQALRGDAVDQVADGAELTLDDQLAPAVADDARHEIEVIGRAGVTQGLALAAVRGQPRRRAAMEHSPLVAPLGSELRAQQLAHQRVVAEPASGAAERGHHRVAPHEIRQPRCAVAAFGERVGQVAREGIHDRRPQEECPQVSGLAVEQLFEEIVGHRPVRRREGGHVRLGLRMVAQRERRQPQSGGPALRATAEHGDLLRVQGCARLGEQLRGLVLGESQMALTDLAQPVREPQPREAQRRVLARHEDEPERRRCLRQQAVEVGGDLATVDLVEVVEHEDDGLLAAAERVAQAIQRRRQVAAPRHRDAEAERRHDEAPEAVAVRVALVQ